MLVGQPLEKLFRDKGIKADVLTSKSQDMSAKLKTADIIVSATGVPGLVKPDMIKEGVVLIDAGTAESNGKLSGDIGEDSYRIASSYSPVPGGVGPMTVAMLLENLVEAAKS